MELDGKSLPYTVLKALKTDKKNIMRFYKTQQYAASFIGQDHCYIVKIGNQVIASAIISAGQESGDFWLLHGLVIAKIQRGNNIASLIIQAIINDKNELAKSRYEKIICFADKKLQWLYKSNNFINYNTHDEIDKLPKEFKQRLTRYRKKQQNLQCYFYSKSNYLL